MIKFILVLLILVLNGQSVALAKNKIAIVDLGGDSADDTLFVPIVISTEKKVLDLVLNGSLRQPNRGIRVKANGPLRYQDGVLGAERAASFTGANSIEVDGVGTHSSFTISTWLYTEDFLEQSEVTLMESRKGANPFRWYFQNKNPSVITKRETRLIFESDAIAGGDGPGGNATQHNYYRFAEHSIEFISRSNSTYQKRGVDAWMHVALTYDAQTKEVTSYLFGREDSVVKLTRAEAVSFENLVIAPTNVAGQKFIGRLREVKAFNYVLSKEELDELGAWEPKLWGNVDINNWLPAETVLYVDGTTGDDGNSGSTDAPVKTIKQGLSLIEGKSTRLVIRPGTYYEHSLVLDDTHGSRLKPIIIEAETPGTVFIDGAIPFDVTWTPTGNPNEYSTPWTADASLWIFDDTVEESDTGNNFGRRTELFIQDGEILRSLDAWNLIDSELSVGQFFIDGINQKLIIRTDKNPNTSVMQQAQNVQLFSIKASNYVVLRDITFQHAGGNGWDQTLDYGGSAHLVIEDVTIRNSGRQAISGGGRIRRGRIPHDHVIRRIHIENVGGRALSATHSYVLLEDIYVKKPYWRMVNARRKLAKSQLFKHLGVNHITLRRVVVDEAQKQGTLLWFDNTNWNIKIEQCAFYQGGSRVYHAIFFEINPANNVVRDSSFAYTNGAVASWSEGITFENNYVKANHARWGLLDLHGGGRDRKSRLPYRFNVNDHISNNTIVSNQDDALTGKAFPDAGVYENNRYFGPLGPGGKQFIPWWKGGQNTKINFTDWMQYETNPTYLTSDPFVGVTAEVGFEQAGLTVKESAKAVLIPINMSLPADQLMNVNVRVVDGTAIEGEDFRLIFDPEERYVPLQIYRSASLLVYKDGISEGGEQFTIELENPENATLGKHRTLTVTIQD